MHVPDLVKSKARGLPDKPGVYLMRDRGGKVIYVGKAKSLRKRVQSYFRSSTQQKAGPKIRGLLRSVADFDVLVVRTEAEAILTEGRMIKEYRPYYNTLFKDDKRFPLLRIRLADPWPRFEVARIRKDDGALYLGPYASAHAARAAKDFVERRYGLRRCRPVMPDATNHKHCLADVLAFCSAPCIARISSEAYHERAAEAVAFLRGERPEELGGLQNQMESLAGEQRFEEAAALRDTLLLLRNAVRQRAKGTKTLAMTRDEAMAGLRELRDVLTLPALPMRIELFDISNTGTLNAVAGMVCALGGLPHPSHYRRFRIQDVAGQDDPAMMAEVVTRRYQRLRDEARDLPDLVVVDGGITQLRAARAALDALGMPDLPVVGLAKRYEEIVWDIENREEPLRLRTDSPGILVLKRLRDEAHRFALTYHRRLRERRIRESILDDIPGVGEKRKEVLLRHFGSVRRMRNASENELAAAPGVGPVFAKILYEALRRP